MTYVNGTLAYQRVATRWMPRPEVFFGRAGRRLRDSDKAILAIPGSARVEAPSSVILR
ncbi:hypothetical protein JOF55_001905 [Haloactinomyces albus]|uniref:Uncharacterized protein n=1 Tax=Haloactinomyces albus TaxID=1352928 RepID=A0AAE3ZEV6_9ACTN|nr:hypothetical protein [Haloactinomyces albus]